jgi:hypothetical protein
MDRRRIRSNIQQKVDVLIHERDKINKLFDKETRKSRPKLVFLRNCNYKLQQIKRQLNQIISLQRRYYQ